MAGRKNTLSIEGMQRGAAKSEPEKFTIEDAFYPHISLDPMPGETRGAQELRERHFDVERGIRAVALLLDQASGGGNEPVEPMEAAGLSFALRRYAADVAHLYVEHERETAFAIEIAVENARRLAPRA